ncbi:phospholipid-transporting ATPase ABCA3-like [Sciurus carolinensis]|uniref:phospholipid-transporting ATPase ABCA3-like n=1 Tax=Sciurus carolinensis TaxID=30640 RepID=UPI001FB1CB4D|nr:phospholipid-transporting ATPase ABCA3-like [Sciurus carolinensis]
MNLFEYKKLMILLWKNFTLKRRKLVALVVEMVLTVVFGIILLAIRNFIIIKKIGPFSYNAYPISDVPSFIRSPVTVPYPWELAYVPSKSIVVQNIVENVKRDLNTNMKVIGFSSERAFEDYVKQTNKSKNVLAAIVFDHVFQSSNDPLPLKVKYYLRFSNFKKNNTFGDAFEASSWLTNSLFPSVPPVGPRNQQEESGGSPGYISEGFLLVQHALDKAIMLHHSGSAAEKLLNGVRIFVQRFPYPMHYQDFFYVFADIFIPLVALCIFSLNHLVLIQSIVWEKENRLKEYQLMIGVSNWMIWAAYFFTFLCLYVLTIIFMCIIFFVKIDPAPIFQYSDPVIVFIFLLFYAISLIFFSFMISTFFDKVNFAVALGGFLFFITYLPAVRLLVNSGQMTFKQKLIFCLCCNVAMALGFKYLLDAESNKTGIKWNNIFSSTNLDNFLFAYVLGMFLFDTFLYGLMTWYIEAVFPGQYGVPKPWNFFLRHSYWFGKPPKNQPETIQPKETIENKYFEAEPTDLVAGIQIKHLHKVFKENNTIKVAIKDLSLNLYEGQITVLLGHNGAGKSTTLSILSGLYPSTSGKAYIHGYEISQHMTEIRKSLGLCPQQDLLFNYLTVSEHLYFYCVIKGVPRNLHLQEIDNMLSAFNLLEKRDAFSKSLSGGMKRKLSIIVALIGNSKVVILDEPTSGMDPASRRATWDLLKTYKRDRTILLTTHYMDEADALGDRIAIMAKGSLQCCGSSIFLKHLYGVGYHVVMVKEPHCKVEEISELIYYHAPTATLESSAGTELSFILPKEYTHRFEALFTALENRQKNLGIASFGVSITTMEEVFLKVGHMEGSQSCIQAVQSPSKKSKVSIMSQNRNMSSNFERVYSSTLNGTIMFNTGSSLYCQQFRAMFLKRLMFSWRNWKITLIQILGLVVSTFFLFRSSDLVHHDEMTRQMDLNEYGQTIVPFYISGSSDLTTSLLEHLESMLKANNHKLKEVPGNLLDYLRENKECNSLCIIAFSLEVKTDETVFTVLFNNEAYHSPSLSLAVLDNILFMSLSGASASLTVSNKPQPHHDNKVNEGTINGQEVFWDMQLGVALLISGFSLLTVTERITKAKHIQFLSGVSVTVYWFSALVHDFIVFIFSCCLLLVMFKYYKIDIYVMDYHFLETMLILTLYGWSAIPLMYLLSFLFSRSSSAYIKLILFNFISGTFTIFIDRILGDATATNLSNVTRNFIRNSLLIFPNYNLGKCIGDYTVIYQMKILCTGKKNVPKFLNCSKENTEKNIYSLEEHTIGKHLIVMSIEGCLFVLFIFLCDNSLWRLRMFLNQHVYFAIYKKYKKDIISKELSGESQDKDVEFERKRILEHPEELMNSPVLIKELTKIYFTCPVILAVKNISLAVQKKECFGLLGYNGAGKTSTFQILTGEESPTSGDVFIDGFSITKNILKVRSRIGYCPQFDALLEYMTGREIMIMYARVCGVSEHQIHLYVNKHLHSLELEPHADSIIRTYSGGNKRRLSTAIAIMGKSSVVFLDEPSTGMDPVARRLLWNTVTKTRESGKAVIITSHSMEECDALCTKVAIMVKGKFMCFGSPQHLKNKFGDIYILKVKVKTEDKLEDFKNFITMTFPDSILKEENQRILNYHVPQKDNCWGKVFGVLEKAKEQFNLEDYSVSQITLEQVFLAFAHLQ